MGSRSRTPKSFKQLLKISGQPRGSLKVGPFFMTRLALLGVFGLLGLFGPEVQQPLALVFFPVLDGKHGPGSMVFHMDFTMEMLERLGISSDRPPSV